MITDSSIFEDPNYTDEEVFNAAVDSLNAVYGITTRFNLHPYMHFKLKNKNPGSILPMHLQRDKVTEEIPNYPVPDWRGTHSWI